MQKIMAGEFFVDLLRMGMVEGVIRAAKASGADAIVRGSGELGGLLAGAILDLPVASAAPAAAKFYEPMIRPGVARAAAEHGFDGERVTAVDYEMLRIDRTPPSLEMPGYVPPSNAINVRPEPYDDGGELPAWFDDLGERPLVYVTLGTVMNGNVPLFRLIADALAGQPYHVVIALGDGVPRGALGEVAGNIQVGGYLPQARILERASVGRESRWLRHGIGRARRRTAAIPSPDGRRPALQHRTLHHRRRRTRRDQAAAARATLGRAAAVHRSGPGGDPRWNTATPRRACVPRRSARDRRRDRRPAAGSLRGRAPRGGRARAPGGEAPRIWRGGQRVGPSPVDRLRTNHAASWARLSSPNLFITLSTWFSAVRTDR